MAENKSALDELVRRCNEMDITEQLNWIGDAILPYQAAKELIALRDELMTLKRDLSQKGELE